jgi:putative phosphoribosyl transferase
MGRMAPPPERRAAGRTTAEEQTVALSAGDATLHGDLTLPADAGGLVVFAHGSGSSRRSVRNRHVARSLQDAGFATLLLDLLDEREGGRRDLVFDITLLAGRLEVAVRWARGDRRLARLPLGLFGASTGAAAALWAAAALGDDVQAIVSRGGRPDLAADRLAGVTAPTLLIVGGADVEVLALNRRAAALLTVEHELEVVPGAGHLFEEPGALEAVTRLAVAWFGAWSRTRDLSS